VGYGELSAVQRAPGQRALNAHGEHLAPEYGSLGTEQISFMKTGIQVVGYGEQSFPVEGFTELSPYRPRTSRLKGTKMQILSPLQKST
jgi:hypothetical protein